MKRAKTALLFLCLALSLAGYWLRMMEAYERDEKAVAAPALTDAATMR